MNWKEIYEKTLKNICEQSIDEFETIVEIEQPEFSAELVNNPNAKDDALYSFKLDDNATEEDYKKFVEYVYGYIGEDINDYLPKEEQESEDNDMQEEKIRKLLKEYGAEDVEIENFMKDLAEVKEDVEDIDDAHKDEVEGAKDYQEMKEENKLDENDETFEDIKEDEEEHQDYLFNAKNMALLKATEEGKDLILKAPKMAKDELEYEIKKYLEKNKK